MTITAIITAASPGVPVPSVVLQLPFPDEPVSSRPAEFGTPSVSVELEARVLKQKLEESVDEIVV